MINGITHQVQQRPSNFFIDCAINLSSLTFQYKLELLLLLKGNGSCRSIKARNHSGKGHQAGLHQTILESHAQTVLTGENTLAFSDYSIHFAAQRTHIRDTLAQATSQSMKLCIPI